MQPYDVAINSFSCDHLMPSRPGDDLEPLVVTLMPSQTFPKGVTVGQNTTTKAYGLYASGNADGTQNPVGFMKYACITDASGNISFSSVVGGDEHGVSETTTIILVEGYFRTEDLVGFDANALSKMGRQISGNLTAGEAHVR